MADRRRVMQRALDEWRYCRAHGWDAPGADQWTWSRCLKRAWAAEKQRAVFAAQSKGIAA